VGEIDGGADDGAEVVQGDPHAGLGQLGEEAGADGGGTGLLAHLEGEHRAGDLLAAQELGDDRGEAGIGHAVGADVHRDRDDHPGRGPDPVLRQRQAQHQPGKLPHQPESFGYRGEQGRRQSAELGMLPPGE
jgi:hypothetical protein